MKYLLHAVFLVLVFSTGGCSTRRDPVASLKDDITHEAVFQKLEFDRYGRPQLVKEIHDPAFTTETEYYIAFYNRQKQIKGYIRFIKNHDEKHYIKFRYEFTRKGFNSGVDAVKNAGNLSPGSQVTNASLAVFVIIIPVVTTTTGFVMDVFHNIIQIPVVMAERVRDTIVPAKDIPVEAASFQFNEKMQLVSYLLLNPAKRKKEIAEVSFDYSGKANAPYQMRVKNLVTNSEKTEIFQ